MTNKVLVIESRKLSDTKKNFTEQEHLASIFRLLGIRCKIVEVKTKKSFFSAIKNADNSHIKYVHFSGHGCKDGIEIGEDDFLTWDELEHNCWPTLKGKCLSFSSCDVALGVQNIFSRHVTFCSAIVAAQRPVSWPESAVAFAAFFLRATDPETSTDQDVRVMNNICGAGTFKLIRSSVANDTYVLN